MVTFKVERFDPEVDDRPYYKDYELEVRSGMTVLDALFDILEKQDGSLAFRYSCRGAVCGSCAMYINGHFELACQVQVKGLKGNIKIGPLPHLEVIKDLVVDMKPFFDKYDKILPYLMPKADPPEKEWVQSQEERKAIDEMIDCILCGSCYAACTMTLTDKEYLGPASLLKAYRFIADSRDRGEDERLDIVNSEHGVWRCHTIFSCVEACPKKINPTWSIQQLKKRVIAKKLKR